MPTRSSKGRQTPDDNDPNVVAFRVIEQATRDDDDEPEAPPEPPPKNPAAVALGRLGGRKGGKARAEALSPEQRKEIASRAARARWEKKEKEGGP